MTTALGGAGAAEAEVLRLGRRFMPSVRLITVAVAGAMALLGAPASTAGHRLAAVFIVVAVLAWNGLYVVLSNDVRPRWLLPADLAVLVGIGLTAQWTVHPAHVFTADGFVFAVLVIATVAYQTETRWPLGLGVTALLSAAQLTGGYLAVPETWVQGTYQASWVLLTGVLARAVFELLRRGGQVADDELERLADAHRQADVAAARRSDERSYLATLHDTAAATLLMVGTGLADRPSSLLSEQAARDLDALRRPSTPDSAEVDLVAMLDDEARRSGVTVDLTGEHHLTVPTAPALALAQSVREALTNVRRHAGVGWASVHLARHGDAVLIEVTDRGQGFRTDQVPAHRHGVTNSIVGRMASAGGRATVRSRPGSGTRVRLEWPVNETDG